MREYKGVIIGLMVLMAAGAMDLAALRYLRKKPPAAREKPAETLALVGRYAFHASAKAGDPVALLQNPSAQTTDFVGRGIFHTGSEGAFTRESPHPRPVTITSYHVPWLKNFLASR